MRVLRRNTPLKNCGGRNESCHHHQNQSDEKPDHALKSSAADIATITGTRATNSVRRSTPLDNGEVAGANHVTTTETKVTETIRRNTPL